MIFTDVWPRTRRAAALALSCMLFVACGSKTDERPVRKETTVASAFDAALPKPKPLSLPKPLPAADVRQLVDAWLFAQVAGDFDAYRALYAEKFTGRKRAGVNTRDYGRSSWLQKRKPTFTQPQKIELANRRLKLSPTEAVVTFEQTVESEKSRDVESKRLVIAPDADGVLRIVREQMVGTDVPKSASKGQRFDPSVFSFVIDTGAYPHMIVDTQANAELGTGPLTLLTRDKQAVVSRSVKRDALPKPFSEWIGKSATLFDWFGNECIGNIIAFDIVVGYEPHSGTQAQWSKQHTSDKQIASDIWAMGNGMAWLGAKVDGCQLRGPWEWGQRSGATSPEVISLLHDPDLVLSAIAQLKRLKGARAVQKRFEATGRKGDWTEFHSKGAAAQAFHSDDDTNRVAVWAEAGSECGEWYGAFWALFEVRRNKLVLLTDPVDPGPLVKPKSAITLGAKQGTVFFSPGVLVREVGSVFRQTEHVAVPVHDSKC